MNTILEIKDLDAAIEDKKIIQNFNLSIKPGEVHVIMGPNGSGKSTLSKILAGHPSYQVNGGEIVFDEKDLLDLSPEQRSHEGLFLAFQYPIEISGVTNYDFLRIAYNEKQKYRSKVGYILKNWQNFFWNQIAKKLENYTSCKIGKNLWLVQFKKNNN